ncbi:MAG: hypothetical protein ACI89L_001251 [Phycisphaerales bacterium]|jgi:hypothetical protein
MNDKSDKFPRLSVEPTEPPATFKFPGDRAADNTTTHEGPDSIEQVQEAMADAQRALDKLDAIADELANDSAIPFPGRDAGADDDDGPHAA